jgi:nitroreductase
MLPELVLKNRSYRRFDGTADLPEGTLEYLVGLTALCPSSRNQQALKFFIVNQRSACEMLFPMLAWAGYLKDWHGPVEAERPTAYIVVLGDTWLGSKFDIDLGICAQTILLGAAERGFGGCMIGSIRKEDLRIHFRIPDHLEILLVIALGKPIEQVVIESCTGDVRYWRDSARTHHVPKRSLEDILILPDML